MGSLNNSHHTRRKGFTLIEILMVIGLISFLAGVGTFFGVDILRGQIFHSDRDVFITALEHARAEAVSNTCYGAGCTDGKPHGVHIGQDRFVVFQGSIYNSGDPLNVVIDATDAVTKGGLTDVVFAQLSGDVAVPGDVTFTDATGHTSTVTIGSEGQITWTH